MKSRPRAVVLRFSPEGGTCECACEDQGPRQVYEKEGRVPTARAVPGPGFKHWGVLGRAWGAQGAGWIAACAGRAQVDSGLVCSLVVTRVGCLSLARLLRARAAKWGPLGHGLWRGLPLGARVPGRHLARREHGRGRCGRAGHAHRLKLFTAFCFVQRVCRPCPAPLRDTFCVHRSYYHHTTHYGAHGGPTRQGEYHKSIKRQTG